MSDVLVKTDNKSINQIIENSQHPNAVADDSKKGEALTEEDLRFRDHYCAEHGHKMPFSIREVPIGGATNPNGMKELRCAYCLQTYMAQYSDEEKATIIEQNEAFRKAGIGVPDYSKQTDS